MADAKQLQSALETDFTAITKVLLSAAKGMAGIVYRAYADDSAEILHGGQIERGLECIWEAWQTFNPKVSPVEFAFMVADASGDFPELEEHGVDKVMADARLASDGLIRLVKLVQSVGRGALLRTTIAVGLDDGRCGIAIRVDGLSIEAVSDASLKRVGKVLVQFPDGSREWVMHGSITDFVTTREAAERTQALISLVEHLHSHEASTKGPSKLN